MGVVEEKDEEGLSDLQRLVRKLQPSEEIVHLRLPKIIPRPSKHQNRDAYIEVVQEWCDEALRSHDYPQFYRMSKTTGRLLSMHRTPMSEMYNLVEVLSDMGKSLQDFDEINKAFDL